MTRQRRRRLPLRRHMMTRSLAPPATRWVIIRIPLSPLLLPAFPPSTRHRLSPSLRHVHVQAGASVSEPRPCLCCVHGPIPITTPLRHMFPHGEPPHNRLHQATARDFVGRLGPSFSMTFSASLFSLPVKTFWSFDQSIVSSLSEARPSPAHFLCCAFLLRTRFHTTG